MLEPRDLDSGPPRRTFPDQFLDDIIYDDDGFDAQNLFNQDNAFFGYDNDAYLYDKHGALAQGKVDRKSIRS